MDVIKHILLLLVIVDCIEFLDHEICKKLPNGDYADCFPLCKMSGYVTCSNGQYIRRLCPAGLNFDAANDKCDYSAGPTNQCPFKKPSSRSHWPGFY